MRTLISDKQEYITPKVEIIDMEMKTNFLTASGMADPTVNDTVNPPSSEMWGN